MKQKRRSLSLRNKEEKQNICASFEKKFDDNAEFDAYIGLICLKQKVNLRK